MRFTLVAAAVGLGIGALAGGRLRFLGERTLRLWPLLAAGLVLQPLSGRADGGTQTVLLVGSYVLLVAFALANVAVVGMWLVAAGIGLNLAVIAVNGGMPVRPSALRAAGLAEAGRSAVVELPAKHHLERPSDRLVVLGDILPVRPLREVVSFGDVVLAVGVADVAAHLLRPPAGRRSRAAGGGGRLDPADATT